MFSKLGKSVHFRNKQKARIVISYAVAWTLAFVYLSIVRGVGTTENGRLQFGFSDSILIAFTMGPLIGLISGYAQIFLEERIYKRISIQRLILLRLLYTLLFMIALIVVAYGTYQLYFGTDIGIITFAFDKGSFAIYFYVFSFDLFLSVLRQVNLMLGEKNLRKFLMGKFYTPREEERVFMFLDLRSSTQLAEQLGHIKYSTMIQDCFDDLGVVIEHEAEVYQYVGDEVILTWDLVSGLRNQNCIRAYFSFMDHLESKSDEYMSKYGVKPFFKAGLNVGVVTVTEVGRYKKEIAYHGDTINTAARIQSKCNDFDEGLLLSGFLLSKLELVDFRPKQLGSIELRGKKDGVEIYALHQE